MSCARFAFLRCVKLTSGLRFSGAWRTPARPRRAPVVMARSSTPLATSSSVTLTAQSQLMPYRSAMSRMATTSPAGTPAATTSGVGTFSEGGRATPTWRSVATMLTWYPLSASRKRSGK